VDGAPTEEPRPDASNARRAQRPATEDNWRVPCSCSCLCVKTPVVAHRCFALCDTLPRSSILCGCINMSLADKLMRCGVDALPHVRCLYRVGMCVCVCVGVRRAGVRCQTNLLGYCARARARRARVCVYVGGCGCVCVFSERADPAHGHNKETGLQGRRSNPRENLTGFELCGARCRPSGTVAPSDFPICSFCV
jgi:hypothetical protein